MRCCRALPILGLLLWSGRTFILWAGETAKPAASPQATIQVSWQQHIRPLLATYCTGCHGGNKPKGHLALDRNPDEASLRKEAKVWARVVEKIRSGEMPPEGKPRPTPAEVDALVHWVESRLARGASSQASQPGQVTLRRLNRAEYNNTIRDLVGVSFQPAEDFPGDDVGYGFDNIGDVLSLPPLLMEKYLSAAEKIVDQAFRNPETRKRIMICQPGDHDHPACARRILEPFLRRAYRRPVSAEEVDRLVELVRKVEAEGDSFEQGIQVALQTILVSPHFLFRVERDPDPRTVHYLNDYELATRLSYFLWSSMPDEELFALAKRHALRQDGHLEAQVRRMLQDPRSQALGENFGRQWLQTRNLQTASPDPGRFPGFDEALRRAMLQETDLFFASILHEDRSVLDFLDARFTFVNERLARHYGMTGIQGEQFRRVALTDPRRGGVLTQAGILTVTSNPTRTSPVKRGKWILENLLNDPPPPPPPGVPQLSEKKEVVLSGSLRQRMEQHRANPNCAACHQRMDPLGFSLENFDAVGAWRDRDGSFAIDASGRLPGGATFQGPGELKALLVTKKEAFCRCLAEKLLTYALGRGVEDYDQEAVNRICRTAAQNNYRFSSLILAVIQSDPFLKRGGK